jgi:hypothetical protein
MFWILLEIGVVLALVGVILWLTLGGRKKPPDEG